MTSANATQHGANQQPDGIEQRGDWAFWVVNGLVSATALGVIAWLLLLRDVTGTGGLSFMPAVNAALNATAAALLTCGWFAVRAGRVTLHRALMLAALACSTVFLVGYLSYHAVAGDTPYAGTGWLRPVYFSILISHIVLSMGIVPGALAALYFAFRKRFMAHRRLTRWLLPAWLYVSVTGVVIYFMLHVR